MENKGIKVLSACLVVLFTVAVVFFAVGIVLEYKNAPRKTQSTLSQFMSDTSMAAEYYIPGTQEFADILRARIASNQNIAVVSIKQAGRTVFAYPVSSPYITADSNGEPQISSTSALVNIKSKAADLAGSPSVVTAAIYTLQPSTIYSYTRIAFLVVLGGTLVAGIALLYLYLTDQQSASTTTFIDDSPRYNENIEEPYSFDQNSNEPYLKTQEDVAPSEGLSEQKSAPEVLTLDDFPVETDLERINESDAQEESVPDNTNTTSESDTINDGLEKQTNKQEQSEPSGLFSPVTGFGWESYLENRLDSELVRSASTEEDIALLIIRIQDLDRTSDVAQKLYELLLDFFKFRDLIFEYKSDGFSCILHSVNVDSAISFAEQVYASLSRTLSESGSTNEVGIGISTRSFRLIPGKRLFTEAEQALEHAFSDPETAIVAFRVDPSKYRQYISECSSN